MNSGTVIRLTDPETITVKYLLMVCLHYLKTQTPCKNYPFRFVRHNYTKVKLKKKRKRGELANFTVKTNEGDNTRMFIYVGNERFSDASSLKLKFGRLMLSFSRLRQTWFNQ